MLLFPLAFAPGRAQLKPSGQPVGVSLPPTVDPLFMFVIKTTLHSDFLFWAATKLGRDALMKNILATPLEDFRTAPAEEQTRALQIMQHILPVSQREKGIWNDSTISPALPRYDLERIRVPTLLISAEDDLYGTFPSARYTADHIPGARFVGYPSGGHLLLGHWKEASPEVVAFLRQATSESHAGPQASKQR